MEHFDRQPNVIPLLIALIDSVSLRCCSWVVEGSVNEKGREIVNLARFCINTSLPESTVWIKTMKLWLTRMRRWFSVNHNNRVK